MPAKSALQRVRFLLFSAKDPKGTKENKSYRGFARVDADD
jgi:hypothetical protein